MSMKNFNAMNFMSLCYYLAVHSVSQLAMTMMKCRHRLMKSPQKPCSIPIPARHFLPIYLRLKMKAAKRERKSHQESTF